MVRAHVDAPNAPCAKSSVLERACICWAMDGEPRIVEMKEDDWVSPEDMRIRAEEQARLQVEKEEAARWSGNDGGSGGSKSAARGPLFELGLWSTALSDAVLVACALWGCWVLCNNQYFAPYYARYSLLVPVVGLIITALAALVGSLRFAGLAFLAPAHETLTAVATATGVPLIAVGALLASEMHLSSHRFNSILPMGVAAISAVSVRGFGAHLGMPLATAGGVAIAAKALAMVGRSIPAAALLLVGVATAVFAGRFVKPDKRDKRHGSLQMLGVDVFHYLFAAALLCFAYGISAATDSVHPPRLLLLAWSPW